MLRLPNSLSKPPLGEREVNQTPEIPRGQWRLDPGTKRQLVVWNFLALIAHGFPALSMYAMAEEIFSFRYQIVRDDYRVVTNANDQRVFLTIEEKILSGNIGYWIAAFPLLSAMAHAFLLYLAWTGRYFHWLEQRWQPLRWIEYTISASVMLVPIALLTGLDDLFALVLIFVLSMITNLTGAFIEAYPKIEHAPLSWSRYTLGLFLLGSFAFLMSWLPILYYFGIGARAAGSRMPDFVYAVVLTMPVIYALFPLNMHLIYTNRVSYAGGERNYLILSFVAKTILWAIVAGGGQREDPPEL